MPWNQMSLCWLMFLLTIDHSHRYLCIQTILICQNCNRFAGVCHQTRSLIVTFLNVHLKSIALLIARCGKLLKLPDHEVIEDLIHGFYHVRVLGPGQQGLAHGQDVHSGLD